MSGKLKPSQFLIIFFSSIIIIGTVLLSLPIAYKIPENISILNSLFMATSSVCVTGLSVLNIGSTYTIFGQIVILILIQIGGLGYMTLATLVALIIGKVSLRDRMIIREIIDLSSFEGLKALLKHIIRLTIIFESIGIVIFTIAFSFRYPIGKAVYYGIFHSISSFCNSGLSLFGNSLEGFRGNYLVLITTIVLVVSGGIGYLVLTEILSFRLKKKLSTHSIVVIVTSVCLIIIGTIGILSTEFTNPKTLGSLNFTDKMMSSLFLSITPRTAGFHTMPTGNLRNFTLFFLLPFMFIGASPGGTGGGIKTTTFALIISSIWSTITGKQDVNLCQRRLSKEIIRKATSIACLGMIVIFCSTMALLIIERFNFLRIIFEVTSAFGTVGLSTGITPYLSHMGKIVIIFTMFIGRLGPLTIGMATLYQMDAPYRYPEDNILIG